VRTAESSRIVNPLNFDIVQAANEYGAVRLSFLQCPAVMSTEIEL